MKRLAAIIAAAAAVFLAAGESRAQWQGGNLALKTNGNDFRSGDQLKVEVIALKAITEPFFTQVSYSYVEPVRVKDEDGKETIKHEVRTRRRDAGPVIEGLKQFQSVALDDTFNFGEGSITGRYTAEVAVFNGYTKERVATLRSCVFYLPQGGRGDECAPFLRALKRAHSDQWLSFEGAFSERGRYSAALLLGGKVVRYVEYGVTTSGRHELNISSGDLAGIGGQTYDLLVHDHDANSSSTLLRVAVPRLP